jgi:sulfur carrier protein ThiS
MTIAEITAKYSLPTVGIMFLLNGEVIGTAVAGGTPVRAGDTLEVARAAKGGRY